MSSEAFDVLLKAIHDHNVPYDHDALKAVYEDPEHQASIDEWIHEHLTPETLLTREEAAIYATLVESGEAERLSAGDLDTMEALDDVEIESAIEELKRSTAAIEKQTEILRLQQNAMKSLVTNGQQASQERASIKTAQSTKWKTERESIGKAVEELSQNLGYQISDLEQQASATTSTSKQTIDTILKADDKLLASLQKLTISVDPGRSKNDETIARIRDLCARLIKHTVEGIRTKLDRVFLEALNGSSEAEPTEALTEVTDLQDELESLYSEILPVAQMSVEHQFLQPALQILAASSGQVEEKSAAAVNYICECLDFLVIRVESLLAPLEESRSHKTALHTIIEATKRELSPPTPSTTWTTPDPTIPPPQRRRTSSATQPQAGSLSLHRRRSSGPDLEPEHQLARNLGITIPPATHPSHSRISTMERSLQERLSKLNIHLETLQSTTESSISSHLRDARITVQMLQDSLFAETPYRRLRFVDPELEGAVENFEADVLYVRDSAAEIDLSVLMAKNVHRDQLVAKWSR